jgi:hypothetical protein
MDEHKHKILVTFVFSMVISKIKKIETPSIIHKQTQKLNKRKSPTREEAAQQEKVNKRREAQQEKKPNKRRSSSTRGCQQEKRSSTREEATQQKEGDKRKEAQQEKK